MNAPTSQRAFELQPGFMAEQTRVPDTVLPHELDDAPMMLAVVFRPLGDR